MRTLVTGGAGFIGSHVVEALLEDGHRVTVLDAASRNPPPSEVESLTGDVRDPARVDRALSGVTTVVHLASMVGLGVDLGSDLPAYVDHNALATAVLLAGMTRHRIRRLVLASSMVVYGEGGYLCPTHASVAPRPRVRGDLANGRFEPRCPHCAADLVPTVVTEDASPDPRNVYAVTKVTQERLAAVWARETAGTALALRFHNVYGPRMPRDTPYAGVASIMRSALRRGHSPQVFEDGAQLRDFVHVRDVAAATALALRQAPSTAFRAYNIASGEPHTIGELANELARRHAGSAPVVTGAYRIGDVRHVTASPERAARELGFTARVSFVTGMAEFASGVHDR